MTLSGLKRHLSLRSGDIDRRLSLGVAIPTSRTELIIQKSKEALARKNQLEKEQESRNTARADQKGSTQNQKNGQVTTTGWQGKIGWLLLFLVLPDSSINLEESFCFV